MLSFTYHLELITPCFYGGAEPNLRAEVRAPSIRVDCKDRLDADTRVDKLRTELLSLGQLNPRVGELLDGIASHLRERDLEPLKQDLLVVSEAAGLLGRAICVRRHELPTQAVEFARSRNLTVILKTRLFSDLRAILHPC